MRGLKFEDLSKHFRKGWLQPEYEKVGTGHEFHMDVTLPDLFICFNWSISIQQNCTEPPPDIK